MTTSAQDFLAYFWKALSKMVSYCLEHGERSQQFFELSQDVFMKLDSSDRDKLDLTSYIKNLSSLLLEHEHQEVQEAHSTKRWFQLIFTVCWPRIDRLGHPWTLGPSQNVYQRDKIVNEKDDD